jgi:catecholate siderophore receptor
MDGMRDFGSYYRDSFNLEQVDVLQGPSAVTFGRGTTGGVVNQASKTAQADPFITGTLNFGTDQTRRITADINQPVPQLGSNTAFRLNVMANDSKVAGRHIAENRRYGVAPSLALGLGTTTRVTFSYLHQGADDTPDYGIPWLFNNPAPVKRANYYGFEDGNYLRTTADIATARMEHDFNSHVSVRSQLRYSHYSRDVLITEAKLAGTVTPSTPLNDINVTRNQIGVNSVETFLQSQTDLTVRFETAGIQHTLVTGLEAGRETSDPTRPTFTNVPGTSLMNPDESQHFSGTSTITSKVTTSALSQAAYVLDTVKLGRKFELTGGIRWDRFDANYQQAIAPVAQFSRVDNMASWRTALVYKPTGIGSVYISYGNSFNPSAEALSLSAANANTKPEKNQTYEAGTKWDLAGGRLSLRGAVFRTGKTNAREPDPLNALQNVLGGNQRVDGFQLEASGRITDRWQMLSSYAYLDSKVVSSRYYPASVGSALANVPKNTLTMWTTYRLPWRIEAGGGGQFIDKRLASSTAPLDPTTGLIKQLPSYWLFNAMAKYPLAEKVDLQVNAYNLTNRYYYDQIHPGHIVPGPGRSVAVGFNFRF